MIDLSAGLPTLEWGEIFHMGIRVADIEVASEELSSSMGISWTPVVHIPMKAWVPGEGYRDFDLDMSHSVEGPIHIELLHGPAGSVWDAGLGAGIHHIGVWVEDVTSTNQALVDAGWTVELAGQAPEEGYGYFTYIRSPSGVLFEPESSLGGGKERFDRWWGGGSLF